MTKRRDHAVKQACRFVLEEGLRLKLRHHLADAPAPFSRQLQLLSIGDDLVRHILDKLAPVVGADHANGNRILALFDPLQGSV